ncbi:MAG: hypothetical protein BZY81_04105 [SAR202 cluster bacterium Io17-Chloro-G4]|nr:MAG: hypothetical protein BZY81_04105 [SAR202 cluster bacterium Io17-Chloro-G4]
MDPATMFSVDHALPEEGAEAAIKAGTDLVLATLQKLDLSQVITTPFGDMPAGHFAMVPMADMVIHRWDLAKGTNQNTNFESNMAEVCIQVLTPALDMGRASGFFGSEVSVPDSASVQDRLLGMSGRTP